MGKRNRNSFFTSYKVLILERMKKNPDDWFWALRYITGEDPASSEDGFDGAVRAWLKWGEDNGYIAK